MGSMVDLDRQRRAAREGALVRPAVELGTLVVTGADRQSWLNGLITCELAKLGAGSGAYGLSTARNGKVFAEIWVVIGHEHILLGTHRDRIEALREHFDRHLIMEDAEI